MEETLDLRQIIDTILKGKKVVIICTILAMIISVILSWFILEEKYQSKAVVQISSGVQDAGIMSNYVATEFTPVVYMQRMQNVEQNKKFFKENGMKNFEKENLSITNQQGTNLIEISYIGKSAEEAQESLKLLMNKTKNEVNSSMKETLNQLEQSYLKESNSLSVEIEELMTNYNDIVLKNNLPELLILQTISSSQFVLNLSDKQTSTLSNITGSLQNELLQLKAQIDTKSEEYRTVLEKYQSVKTGLDSFKPDPYIRIIIDPTFAETPKSPNKLSNLILGIILGLIVGIGIVFSRVYWKSNPSTN